MSSNHEFRMFGMMAISTLAFMVTCATVACSQAADGPSTKPTAASSPVSKPAGGSAFPLWDGKETVSDYAKRAGLKDTELSLDLGNRVTMKLVLIPAGKFVMGSPKEEFGRTIYEGPQREVTISKAFHMGAYEVTRGQFAQFASDSGYKTDAEKDDASLIWDGNKWATVKGASWKKPGFEQTDDHPAVCISHNDAVEFCKWLARKTGKVVSLPTEAQWEYAARAGTKTANPWGNDPDGGKGWANCVDQAARKTFAKGDFFSWDDGYTFTSPVGKFKANAFGLYDMIGNVWEWCGDWYDRDYYSADANTADPQGPASGTDRALRGACWAFKGGRSALRFRANPDHRDSCYGFRIVVELSAADGPSTVRPAATVPTSSTQEQIKTWIKQLDDADYKIRSTAQKSLTDAGTAALDALAEAARSNQAEVKQRAEQAIKDIRNAQLTEASAEAARNYLWSCPIESGPAGSPAVSGGRAYLTSADRKLHAVDLKTGKALWAVALPAGRSSSMQVSAGDRVVVVAMSGLVAAYDVQEGKSLWEKKVVASAPASAPASRAGPGAAQLPPAALIRPYAVIVGDLVITTLGIDKLSAVKAMTGEQVWEVDAKQGRNWCNVLVVRGAAYLASDNAVTAIDLASHRQLWSCDLENCLGLALGGKTLCCVTNSTMVGLDAQKGSRLWEENLPGGPGPGGRVAAIVILRGRGWQDSVVPADDARVYLLIGDELSSYDLKTGGKSTVRLDLSLPDNPGTQPPGLGSVMTNAPSTMIARWTVADGVFYLAGYGGLFGFDAKTGRRLWGTAMEQVLSADPVVVDSVLYLATIRQIGLAATAPSAAPKDLPGLHAWRPGGK